jgi:hypothetical protein
MRNKGEIGPKWEFGELGRFLREEELSQEGRSSIQTILTESRFKSFISSTAKPSNLASLLKEQHTVLKHTGGLGGKGFLKHSLIDRNRVEIIDRSLNKSSLEQYNASHSGQTRPGLKERIASIFCARKGLPSGSGPEINLSHTFLANKGPRGPSVPHRRTASSMSCQKEKVCLGGSSKPALSILKNFKGEKDLLLTKLQSPQRGQKNNVDLGVKKWTSNQKIKTREIKDSAATTKPPLHKERAVFTQKVSSERNQLSSSKIRESSITYQNTPITKSKK